MHKIIFLRKRRRRQQSHPGQSGVRSIALHPPPRRSLYILWPWYHPPPPTQSHLSFSFTTHTISLQPRACPPSKHVPFSTHTQSIRFEPSTKKQLNRYRRPTLLKIHLAYRSTKDQKRTKEI